MTLGNVEEVQLEQLINIFRTHSKERAGYSLGIIKRPSRNVRLHM